MGEEGRVCGRLDRDERPIAGASVYVCFEIGGKFWTWGMEVRVWTDEICLIGWS